MNIIIRKAIIEDGTIWVAVNVDKIIGYLAGYIKGKIYIIFFKEYAKRRVRILT